MRYLQRFFGSGFLPLTVRGVSIDMTVPHHYKPLPPGVKLAGEDQIQKTAGFAGFKPFWTSFWGGSMHEPSL